MAASAHPSSIIHHPIYERGKHPLRTRLHVTPLDPRIIGEDGVERDQPVDRRPAELRHALGIAVQSVKASGLDRLGDRRADDAVGVTLRMTLDPADAVPTDVPLRPRRHEEQPIVLRMLEAEADVGHPQLDQPLDRVGDLPQPLEARAERTDVLGDQLAEQRLLVGEVVIDRRRRSARDRPRP